MKNITRETLTQDAMVKLVKSDLREFNISERIIESVIRSYLGVKKEALAEGKYVKEDGITTTGLKIRGVSERFSDKRYTVKVHESINVDFREFIINKLNSDEEFREIMGFDPESFKHNKED